MLPKQAMNLVFELIPSLSTAHHSAFHCPHSPVALLCKTDGDEAGATQARTEDGFPMAGTAVAISTPHHTDDAASAITIRIQDPATTTAESAPVSRWPGARRKPGIVSNPASSSNNNNLLKPIPQGEPTTFSLSMGKPACILKLLFYIIFPVYQSYSSLEFYALQVRLTRIVIQYIRPSFGK